MKKLTFASLALAGALALSGCAVTYPADPAPATPATGGTSAPATAETPTTAPDPAALAGEYGNPIPVATDGSTVIDVATGSAEVFATAAANSSLEVVVGDTSIDGAEASDGLQIEETERGVRVTVLRESEQYVVVYDGRGFEHWVYINYGAN